MKVLYGYKVENGKVVVNESEAEKIRQVFKEYLKGNSLMTSRDNVGLKVPHSAIRRLIRNKKYLGDNFYPRIIDDKTFDETEIMIQERMEKNKKKIGPKKENKAKILKDFVMKKPIKKHECPFVNASYLYSLIEGKEEYLNE